MDELITAFLIACSSFLISDYLLLFLISLKWGRIHKAIDRKPFNCAYCLSIWLTVVYSLSFDIEFIYYIGVTPIFANGINRHLKDF